jgi:hypothetical protein
MASRRGAPARHSLACTRIHVQWCKRSLFYNYYHGRGSLPAGSKKERRAACSQSLLKSYRVRLSALILLYIYTLKGIYYPRQQNYLLYTIVFCVHVYSTSQLYTNYHILYYFFPIQSLACGRVSCCPLRLYCRVSGVVGPGLHATARVCI